MATSKTLTPTNVTIQIPAFTDAPDQRVNSNCIDKEADAINALNSKIANIEFKNKLAEQLTEANNINLFGEYIGRGNSCHGLPTTDATYYFLIGLWNTQIAVDSDNSHFYTRIYINNAWTSWRTI